MKQPLYVGVSGKKQSGKDTFTNLLRLKLAGLASNEVTHFADPLKEIIHILYGVPKALLYGSDNDKNTLTHIKWEGLPPEVRVKYGVKKKFLGTPKTTLLEDAGEIACDPVLMDITEMRSGHMSIRELLQVFGTDIIRERVYYNTWAELPFRKEWPSLDVLFISDTRFQNEIDQILGHNGIILRVVRPDLNSNDNHPSETALDNYNWNQDNHYVIYNNSTLDDLTEQANQMAKIIRERLNGRK